MEQIWTIDSLGDDQVSSLVEFSPALDQPHWRLLALVMLLLLIERSEPLWSCMGAVDAFVVVRELMCCYRHTSLLVCVEEQFLIFSYFWVASVLWLQCSIGWFFVPFCLIQTRLGLYLANGILKLHWIKRLNPGPLLCYRHYSNWKSQRCLLHSSPRQQLGLRDASSRETPELLCSGFLKKLRWDGY